MPNRIVREGILTSDRVNKLTWAGENYFRRLMSVVDDYGRFDGRPGIIRISAFPLKVNQVSESDIVKWSDECSAAGLIRFYEVDSKRYMELLDFDQRLRIKKSKYPAPTDDGHASDIRQPVENQNPNSNPKQKIESEGESEHTHARTEMAGSVSFSPPSLAMCEQFFEGCGFPKNLGAKFFNEYSITGWRYKGSVIENWTALAQKWVINESNYQNGQQQRNSNSNNKSFAGNKRDSLDGLENLAKQIIRESSGSNGG